MKEFSYTLGPVILLDIEGTTTSISFVKDTLFPFVRNHVTDFLRRNWLESEVVDIIKLLRAQCEDDLMNGMSNAPKILSELNEPEHVITSVVKNVLWQMDEDRKTTSLKSLQGKIWKLGFEEGRLFSDLFPDVPEALARWNVTSKKVYIYSSGSIDAQKLVFRYVESGSLSHFLSGYFDTTTGPKLKSQSYRAIAAAINESPKDITFFTDSLKEADAAMEAGIRVIVMSRPGNPDSDIDIGKYDVAYTFAHFN